jgi:class 3 adenylate cyclase
LTELEGFFVDVVEGEHWEAEPERVLATVLFTDIVDATARATELGDRAWRELLHKHHETVRLQLGIFRGREIDTAGDGFFASFDGPARAILGACSILDSVRGLGIEVRAGLHTGECEVIDDKVGGIAVHIGARIAALAGPNEVLVSSTVKDLVAGSEIEFEDRGEHQLKGISEAWHLFRVRNSPASV